MAAWLRRGGGGGAILIASNTKITFGDGTITAGGVLVRGPKWSAVGAIRLVRAKGGQAPSELMSMGSDVGQPGRSTCLTAVEQQRNGVDIPPGVSASRGTFDHGLSANSPKLSISASGHPRSRRAPWSR